VAVAGQPAGHDQLVLAGAAGDGGLAGVACQRVRRPELLGVVADFAARERLPLVDLACSGLLGTPVPGGAEQQRAHPAFPGPALRGDQQQLGGGQADGVGQARTR